MANPQAPFQQRFAFGGINLANPPDAMPANKYAAALNIRSNPAGTSIYTRPGSTFQFSCNNNPITDMRAYATLATDDNPRLLARDTVNGIYLDNGVLQTTLGNNGFGVRMIPFRPSESPQSYMYIYAANNSAKISAPIANNTIVTNIGIAEPQNECEFSPNSPFFSAFTGAANNWANGGTAGSPSDVGRSNENITIMIADPIRPTRYSVQPANNGAYQVGEHLQFFPAANNNTVLGETYVQLVLPPIANNNTLIIQAIRYDNGSNGMCTVVPSQMPLQGSNDQSQIGSLERGSLIQFVQGNTTETSLVLAGIPGPSGAFAIRCSTNNTFSANATINGIEAIVVDANNTAIGNATNMRGSTVSFAVGAASNNNFATLTETPPFNPFATQLGGGGGNNSNVLPQQDDYVHISVLVDQPAAITEIKLMFNVDATDNNFVDNVLYYSIRQSDLTPVVTGNQTFQSAIQAASNNAYTASQTSQIQLQIDVINAQMATGVLSRSVGAAQIAALDTQLVNLQQLAGSPSQSTSGNNQWSEIWFPISGLTRIGNDLTRTLMNLRTVQVWVNASANCNMKISSLWVSGGWQPDTGDTGAAYQYQLVPRNQTTGASGNPSPVPLYGMYTRRQAMTIQPPSFAYDSQIDVYDVYRYGGSVTSWRYIGTGTVGNNFVDNFTDENALGGNEVQLDNFQPWPSVDVPFKAVSSNNNSIQLYGTSVVVTLGGGATFPASTPLWLPGTVVAINQYTAYSLWVRPVSLGNNSFLFKFNQATGSGNANTFWVNEPLVAAVQNPYTWGPDAAGTVFGCGDPFRPGTVSFTKSNAPDSVPDSYNLDLTPPSEPLMGGEIVSGVSLIASTMRWWALYPDFGGTERYQATERNVGRGLLTPYGHCTDGTRIYFWTRDGISMTAGEAAQSLTNADLYPLFPHDGIPGRNIIRNLVTFYAPDYSRASQFRLCFSNFYLYAIYPDSTGTFRTLVCDVRTGAWSQDSYATPMSGAYAVEQQEGTITSANNNSYSIMFLGLSNGNVNQQSPFANDNQANNNNGTLISCGIQTQEWDGSQPQAINGMWRDTYVDAVCPNGMNITPMSLGVPASNTTVIPAGNNTRRLLQGAVDPGTIERFLGVQITWSGV